MNKRSVPQSFLPTQGGGRARRELIYDRIPLELGRLRHDRIRVEGRRTVGRAFRLEIAGGIDPTAGRAAAAGAEILVAGSAVFGAGDRGQAMGAIRAAGSGE